MVGGMFMTELEGWILRWSQGWGVEVCGERVSDMKDEKADFSGLESYNLVRVAEVYGRVGEVYGEGEEVMKGLGTLKVCM